LKSPVSENTGLFCVIGCGTMKTVAIIPAGGSGKRMESDVSKQYLLLKGIPILAHTLRAFQAPAIVNDIFLVIPPQDLQYVQEKIIDCYGISKARQILSGGKERQDSVKNGLDAVDKSYDIVLVHDGVRPFVSLKLIEQVIQEALENSAVAVGIPVSDTVKTVNRDGWVQKTLKRTGLWLTQTPQAFRRETIKQAYQAAYRDDFYGTDDASLVVRIGVKVKMIVGSRENIKITTMEDMTMGEHIMKKWTPVQSSSKKGEKSIS
jgi:2-C-methyl-D-erythritol 4-phosphate cytidylyltransferase